MNRKIMLLFLLIFVLSFGTCYAENWVEYLDGGYYQKYYDSDYCKEVTIDGYDVWKLREKIVKYNKYSIKIEFYNVDSSTCKSVKMENYDLNTNKLISSAHYPWEWWRNLNQKEIDEHNKIVKMIQDNQNQ